MGDIVITRMNSSHLTECGKHFRYNVFMKKYVVVPIRVTSVRKWLKWITETMDGKKEEDKV